MSRINPNRLFRVWLPAVALLLLGGCAGQQLRNEEPRLMERAEAYWKARELGDFQTVFRLESAAEPRGWLTPSGAASLGRGISLSSVKISDPKIEGDTAEVAVEANVRYAVMVNTGSQPFRQTIRDFWVKIDGEWFHKTHEVKSLGKLQKDRLRRLQEQGEAADVDAGGDK